MKFQQLRATRLVSNIKKKIFFYIDKTIAATAAAIRRSRLCRFYY